MIASAVQLRLPENPLEVALLGHEARLENAFDTGFVASLAQREKQIQQNYRPLIGVHKWFARRPGTVFRSLLLAEFGSGALNIDYWDSHSLHGVIADPFMGGGTTVYEANRLGFSVVGADVNPMAYWIVHQALAELDLERFAEAAAGVATDIELELGNIYSTRCKNCEAIVPVKYFLWVKVESCPACGKDNDLFPGYLLAEAVRHPKHVLVCSNCGELGEYERQPRRDNPAQCGNCGYEVLTEGPARRQRIQCRHCSTEYAYPSKPSDTPPRHRMWAIEYHCEECKPTHAGRFFKAPDHDDLARFEQACEELQLATDMPIPDDEIPAGDETDRLHRWGYRYFREMFNDRQLFGLGSLLRRLREIDDPEVRHALLTVFSDFLRYQNMLCRYDSYALKCQDIFSVHGFPVGLVQCENNLLGIPRVGSGSFRHFVEKYLRAKHYCKSPFETHFEGKRKVTVRTPGERIEARFVDSFPEPNSRNAWLVSAPSADLPLPAHSLDGVFTDPPYFANVQYAELMDFCFAWLRLGLEDDVPEFRRTSTKSGGDLTGNTTLGRGIDHFTAGLSEVFQHYAAALKPGAPFVFTYHHNDPLAYAPLVVSILDAGMHCTATLPAVAEMSASLHIAGTGSSVVDSVFVCRNTGPLPPEDDIDEMLQQDATELRAGGVRLSIGDLRCLVAGHIARRTVNRLAGDWDRNRPLEARMSHASTCLSSAAEEIQSIELVKRVVQDLVEVKA